MAIDDDTSATSKNASERARKIQGIEMEKINSNTNATLTYFFISPKNTSEKSHHQKVKDKKIHKKHIKTEKNPKGEVP